jgi:hypothetical protein
MEKAYPTKPLRPRFDPSQRAEVADSSDWRSTTTPGQTSTTVNQPVSQPAADQVSPTAVPPTETTPSTLIQRVKQHIGNMGVREHNPNEPVPDMLSHARSRIEQIKNWAKQPVLSPETSARTQGRPAEQSPAPTVANTAPQVQEVPPEGNNATEQTKAPSVLEQVLRRGRQAVHRVDQAVSPTLNRISNKLNDGLSEAVQTARQYPGAVADRARELAGQAANSEAVQNPAKTPNRQADWGARQQDVRQHIHAQERTRRAQVDAERTNLEALEGKATDPKRAAYLRSLAQDNAAAEEAKRQAYQANFGDL